MLDQPSPSPPDAAQRLAPFRGDVIPSPPWNRRIPSDKAILGRLHMDHPWIPGEHQIRPSEETLDRKKVQMSLVDIEYASLTDYILRIVFKFQCTIDVVSGKMRVACPWEDWAHAKAAVGSDDEVAAETLPPALKVFQANEFPYRLSDGSHHFIMWYLRRPPELTEDCINADIADNLQQHLGRSSSGVGFEFVWYENPKMSVPGVYHVQVFWHEV